MDWVTMAPRDQTQSMYYSIMQALHWDLLIITEDKTSSSSNLVLVFFVKVKKKIIKSELFMKYKG